MASILVKDLMIPLADYVAVSQEATLYEVVRALEEAQNKFNQNRYQHRAVLVYDKREKIVGKLSQLDLFRALEPKYQDMGDFKGLDRYGINADYIRSLIKELGLMKKPLDDICRKAATVKVKSIMYTLSQGEYVDEGETLNEAMVQFLVGRHQSLLVTRDKEIVGILRLTDVFRKVCEIISSCEI